MRLLIDTHAFLWWVAGSKRLSKAARDAIDDEDADGLISAASAWEITTKFRLGKLPDYAAVAADVPKVIVERGFQSLPISVEHAHYAGALSGAHGDPFDRMLAAQALLEGVMVITNDKAISAFGVRTLW
ncbi:MAG TPA: type II toxin-antitoxin system VapC family toxin [Caulobacterales bacterium]|jgi:PIN domain nuclease of toxin-antitoxin system|nr:type II toxin-antitoxin system VapC family toxin [Caulobacterales bacterium]